jgi:uncharacterized protein (DUF1697 family)
MALQAAMLRGVNLGKRQVVMAELRKVCEGAGFTDVKTLIASGNLVLNARQSGAKLEAALETAILHGLGLKTDVHVRTHAGLEAVIANNPFKAFAKTHPNYTVVYFMRAPANAAELAAMKASAVTEEFRQGEHCLYLKFPDGQGRSKLKLPKLGTARNWNTVGKLAAMTAPA